MSNAILDRDEKLQRSQIGYREGPKENETKYGAWFGMNFVAWCAIYQSWSSAESGTTYLGKPWRFASTIAARDHAKKNKRWITTPTVGTIAMMAHTKTTGHVGRVIYVLNRNGQIIVGTIEGNTNDQGAREGNGVWLRERSASSWDGYIVLDQTFLQDASVSPTSKDDDMPLHYYKVRDEQHPDQPHPTLGNGIWISDGLRTNIMSDHQFVDGRNLGWYPDDDKHVQLVPEDFHNALVETSRGGNLGESSMRDFIVAIKQELDDPNTHGGSGLISKEAIDEIAKAVIAEIAS